MRIGMFDSGIGGLTVLNKFLKKYPNHQYIYFGDTIHIPYGNKSKEQLKNYSNKIISFLLDKNVDLIIIACGTISSNLDVNLKNKYSIKIIDIITPTINYLNNNKYNKVGVIATPMTIKSKIFESKLKMPVISIACPKFVPMIEEGLIDTYEFNQSLIKYLKPLKEEKIDSVVLGCTHYSIINKQIQRYFGNNIKLIDLGEVLVNKIVIDKKDKNDIELNFSYLDNNIMNNIEKIVGKQKVYKKTYNDF